MVELPLPYREDDRFKDEGDGRFGEDDVDCDESDLDRHDVAPEGMWKFED